MTAADTVVVAVGGMGMAAMEEGADRVQEEEDTTDSITEAGAREIGGIAGSERGMGGLHPPGRMITVGSADSGCHFYNIDGQS